ncbi:MAG: lytic transglycosylase domain-containing protein, partial [Brucella sp.]
MFIPFGIAATCAEERGAIAPFAQDGDAEAATHNASGSRSDLTVFNRRWTSESKEFVVGSDG